jgi:MFS family permease
VTASLLAALGGTFLLRMASGLTAAMLVYYLADLPRHGGAEVSALTVGVLTAAFYAAELILSPLFGVLSDRLGHHRLMQAGPLFGAVAVAITAVTTDLTVLGATRLLEGASAAVSVPSILGYLAAATVRDEGLRGRAAARFEAATVAGLGAGVAAAGVLYTVLGPPAFFLNALLYVASWVVYRYGVSEAPGSRQPHDLAPRETAWRRYGALLRASHVWLLAPTWIALNAALGLYTSQTLFQLVRSPDPRFPDQLLVGGFGPLEVTAGFVVAGVVFFAGLAYWGDRFKRYRRTTIIVYGLVGGAVLAGAALALNHSAGLPALAYLPILLVGGAGLFVLAGATPAALGLLADMSEHSPDDRGALMGLYSVFFSLGQIGGLLLGGVIADATGLDGIFVATLVILAVALAPVAQLRRFEARQNGLP